jgi:hypothetical protein
VSDVIALLDTPYFIIGVRLGLLGLALGWGLRLATGRTKPPLPIAGLLIGVAMVVTLVLVDDSVVAELPGLALIVLASGVASILKAPLWVHPLVVAPGAIWVAFATPVTELFWARLLMILVITVGGFLITDFERRHAGLGLGPIFYALAVFGVFAAVPDTEWAVAMVAVTIPIAFLAWPRVAASLGTEGAYLAVAVFMWVIVQGGAARPPSIVGSAACLGLLVLEPLVIALRPSAVALTTWVNRNALGAVVASLPQVFVVVLSSRVAARFTAHLPTVVVIVVVYAIVLIAGLRAGPRELRVDEEEDDPEPDLFDIGTT